MAACTDWSETKDETLAKSEPPYQTVYLEELYGDGVVAIAFQFGDICGSNAYGSQLVRTGFELQARI